MRIVSRSWLLLYASLLGCTGPFLPEGDAEAGRIAFQDLGCVACHRVRGEGFPEPVADPPVPFVLGTGPSKSRRYLAESIIAPSHRFARPLARSVGDPPMLVEQPEYENIREGAHSRMGDYSDTMSVRQWLDLIAFLESVQRGS